MKKNYQVTWTNMRKKHKFFSANILLCGTPRAKWYETVRIEPVTTANSIKQPNKQFCDI